MTTEQTTSADEDRVIRSWGKIHPNVTPSFAALLSTSLKGSLPPALAINNQLQSVIHYAIADRYDLVVNGDNN